MRPIEKLIEKRKEEFIRNNLMSDEFIDFIQKNKKPMDKLLSYYACAIMEVETKFRVLDHQYSLEYDRNPIEDIKSRVKSWESLIKKVRRKEIPLTLSSIEENIHDIAGVRVVCSFPDDIYMLADCLLNQDDITLIEKKGLHKKPKTGRISKSSSDYQRANLSSGRKAHGYCRSSASNHSHGFLGKSGTQDPL